MTPTPTEPGRPLRRADFATLAEALECAAQGETGVNLHDLRGGLAEVLTWSQLAEQAEHWAARLAASGLEPGDRVGLAAASDGDFLRAFFACQLAGFVPAPLPLPAPFGGKEQYVGHIRRMMRSASLRAALAPTELAQWFEEAGEDLGLALCGPLASAPQARPRPLPRPSADDLCYVQFSSGSTRFPLGVAVTHRALMANVRAITGGGLEVAADDRAVSWLPLYHDMGLVGMLLSALGSQRSIDLLPTGAFVRRPRLWLDIISSRGGTISYAPTFGYELAVRRGAASQEALDLSRWRVAGLGGDMIRPAPLAAFAETFAGAGFDSRAFVASYGMAEATLALSMAPVGAGLEIDEVDIGRLERTGEARPAGPSTSRRRSFALCGPPLPAHEIEIRDPDGRSLPERCVGRIFARGPSLMRAYLDAPDETEAVLADGWLDTGDLGYRLAGQLVITGRAKDLMIVNGRNLWPQDLEWSAECEVEGLRSGDVAVFSVAAEAEEQVVALVQCRTSSPETRADIARRVAAHLRVRHGVEVDVAPVPPHSLPQTSSGKLSRAQARALYLSGAFIPRPVQVEA